MKKEMGNALRYDRSQVQRDVKAVDKRVVTQGNEIFSTIQAVFQLASFPIQTPLFYS